MFRSYMNMALEEAAKALERGEVPIGAVIVENFGNIVARAGNETRARLDPSAHAEVLAIREACTVLKTERLVNCDMYVTLEPCAMCAALIANARIRRIYFAASDPKSGGIQQGARIFDRKQTHHVPEIYSGIGEEKAAELLRNFFSKKRFKA
ncbi:MAG: nucleoside deaminase [Rhodobacteraceae bacterium TMED160]|jgi:tRNA(Arg) A34 adenosine deaminase TadA|nr:MAG: nucleoside deaminase [Rhodobacteraceae bacterium TMED160]